MQRASVLATRAVGRHFGELFPFYYVMEYPKSGGSWLSDMIADYLQIPRPVMPVFPVGFTAVLHGHWDYSPRYRRVFYLYRDGRDVAVSMYFRVIHEMRNPHFRVATQYYAKRFPELATLNSDADDIRAQLPVFLRRLGSTSAGTRFNWAQHVSQWAFDRPHVVPVSYEELLSDPEETLGRIIPLHSGEPVVPERLAATVAKYSFEAQTGRKPGSEVRGAFIRKGVAGDWRNHFSREAGEAFDTTFGDILVRLGYEPDRNWYQKLPDS